jgi:hypothetical protein
MAGPLVVAEHREPGRGQRLRDLLERREFAAAGQRQCLVAAVGAGAADQEDAGVAVLVRWRRPRGQQERA